MTNESRTRPSLQNLVREHYEDNALPQASLDRLRTLTADSRPRQHVTPRWLIVAAIAATLAIVAVGVGVIDRAPDQSAAVSAAMQPKLIAVQIHADWCARSPEVAPIFAELLTQYGNEPVLFVTLDITDDVHREQARLLSANLGIPQAFDEPFESGMIKLIDRENRTVLASITGREQAEELEVRLAELLDRNNEDGA